MAAAPIGAVVRITYDSDAIVRDGDILRTARGRLYLVIGTRIQTRGKHAGRQHLQLAVIAEIPDDHGAIHPLMFYRRERSRP